MSENNQAQTTSTASPTVDDPAPIEQPGADENAASSAESPGATENSPTPKGEKAATLEDAIAAALEPEKQSKESPTEEKAEPGEKSDDEPGDDKDEPVAKEKKDDQTDKVLSPKKHGAQERIEQLAREKNELKGVLDELRRYTGDDKGFNNFRELLKLHAEDPAKAVPLLEQVLEDARIRAGLVISEVDIKQRLESGLVDEDSAKELQQARLAKARAAKDADNRIREQAESMQAAQVTALQLWEKNVKERNPDYDTLAQQVQNAFVAKANRKPPGTPEEAVAVAQEAYDEVVKWARQFKPAQQSMKPTPSTGSSARIKAKPTTLEGLIDQMLS